MRAWLGRNWPELLEIAVVSALAVGTAAIIWVTIKGEVRMDELGSIELMETQAGAPRFTYGSTNLPHVDVILDNETGVQYLCRSEYGITPILSSDGRPALVGEAGD